MERQSAWINSTDILIQGFLQKLKKMKEDVEILKKKRKDTVQNRLKECQNRLIQIHKLIENAKKEKDKQEQIMDAVTRSTMQE